MQRTPLCDLLGVRYPILQAPMAGVATAHLAAAVTNAGGLGSIAAALQPASQLREQIEQARSMTDGPFAVNHLLTMFDRDAFEVTLQARPAVISFALGDPGALVDDAHEAGALVMQQVVTVAAGRRAAEAGVDIIIAQGGEGGGNSGLVATLPLVPQVVDAVAPVPVVAAGGVGDGRGLAAALVLGAQGVNLGTRFIATTESAAAHGWKHAIVQARSSDVVKFGPMNAAFPPASDDYFTIPATIVTPFVEETLAAFARGDGDPDALRSRLMDAGSDGNFHELVPLAGQSAGLVSDIPTVAELIERLVTEAEAALMTARANVVDA
jgi:enoyl-[acyl-carrier protein] reductase II